MNRNNYIYTWQKNRNPFIDYPNLADYIWGANAGQVWYASLSNTTLSNSKVIVYPNPSRGVFVVEIKQRMQARFEISHLLPDRSSAPRVIEKAWGGAEVPRNS